MMFGQKKYWITPGGEFEHVYGDMLEQPHLMIAGATGSGKSVIENEMLIRALMKAPTDMQFIMIDMKRVELWDYKDLPHTLKYASEPIEAVEALEYAIKIVDYRYKNMQNRRIKKYDGGDLYVVIDEFADLMTTNKKKIQPLVQRLCQIGRAAKVHVVICTQSPIAKVIPTEIKVNFDSRIALRTSCAQDSRNIIGVNGCESLPAYGYGYYKKPSGIIKVRFDMSDESEHERIINWWKDKRLCQSNKPPMV